MMKLSHKAKVDVMEKKTQWFKKVMTKKGAVEQETEQDEISDIVFFFR